MNLGMILATDENCGIGFDNQLPWPRVEQDMKWFRSATLGRSLLMGRKTWESLPKRPLPGRFNMVLSSTEVSDADFWFDSKIPIESIVRQLPPNTMVIGGAQLYEAMWPYIDTLYWTTIKGRFKCDRFFNVDARLALDPSWGMTISERTPQATLSIYRKRKGV